MPLFPALLVSIPLRRQMYSHPLSCRCPHEIITNRGRNTMNERIYNFNPGPAVLPEDVLREVQA